MGAHCGNRKDKFEKAELLNDESFTLYDNAYVERTKILDRAVFNNMMPKKNKNRVRIYFGILCKMIKSQLS